jgi:hypothetical protein
MKNMPLFGMRNLRIARWIVTIVALFTMVSPFLADWNRTHVYNSHWPPHAKFHGGQTVFLGALTGALALWCLWRRRGDELKRIGEAAVLSSLYWISQALAILTPGAAFFDPELRDEIPTVAGVRLNQAMLDAVVLALLLGAYALARRGGSNKPESGGR